MLLALFAQNGGSGFSTVASLSTKQKFCELDFSERDHWRPEGSGYGRGHFHDLWTLITAFFLSYSHELDGIHHSLSRLALAVHLLDQDDASLLHC